MQPRYKLIFTAYLFLWANAGQAARPPSDWGIRSSLKSTMTVPEEPERLRRDRVTINRTIEVTKPNIEFSDLDTERAVRYRIDQKTVELIKQLEALSKRPSSSTREGEVKMRLAEMYYDQSQILAQRESADWSEQLKRWEGLDSAKKQRTARPVLKTPRTDSFRKKSLSLYRELEVKSRSNGAFSASIRRDEVLFYLGSTYLDLGQRKSAISHYEELTRRYPRSTRALAARLNLADLYFENSDFAEALPHYLKVASDADKAGSEAQEIKGYAMYKLAWCYRNTNQYKKAVLAYKKTVELSESNKSAKSLVFKKEALNDLAYAFALSKEYNDGEAYFKRVGDDEMLFNFYRVTANTARNYGDYKISEYCYNQLIELKPNDREARTYAGEIADLYRVRNNYAEHSRRLGDLLKTYGEGSRWLSRQDMKADEEKLYLEELVQTVRKEAKDMHQLAQKTKRDSYYRGATEYYDVYFSYIPKPNPDTAENVHEMRFFFAETLYQLREYKRASDVYAQVGNGKYASAADYNRILAVREGIKEKQADADDLQKVTKDFLTKYPKDERAAEMIYLSAYETFNKGDYKDALVALQEVVARFPNSTRGVEAAQRILFIHEKENNYEAAVAAAQKFLANGDLVKTGGAPFQKELQEYQEKAVFKRIEAMPDSSESEAKKKSLAYIDIAKKVAGSLKETALNNAVVYAEKSKDDSVLKDAREQMLAAFPNSQYSKNLYLQKADALARDGKFREALAQYNQYQTNFKQKGKDFENAQWNIIYIRSHLEDAVFVDTFPSRTPSRDLMNDVRQTLKEFPRNENRGAMIDLLLLSKGSTSADFALVRGLPSLGAKERESLQAAEILDAARSNNRQQFEMVVKRYPSSRINDVFEKEALGYMAFALMEPEFAAYQRRKVSTSASRFVPTLKEKLNALESIEKRYLNVVSYGSPEHALKSLQRLSVGYREFADEIVKGPAPKEELEALAAPLRQKGIQFLDTCVGKAKELKITGSGLAACKNDLRMFKPQLVTVTDEMAPTPQWLPEDISKQEKDLMRTAIKAFSEKRYGEFQLAASIAAKNPGGMSDLERGQLDLMSGLLEWYQGRGQTASTLLRKVGDSGDSRSLRDAALKNLAALYASVEDFEEAASVASSLKDSDPGVAWIRGYALMGAGDAKAAASAYKRGISSRGANQDALLFNMALAQYRAGDKGAALSSMKEFVDIASPAGSHPARRYISIWSRE
ncbi:MAG TPA: tetratricopeptide repeat protein [Bdellovibrionota bacterium]|nr:tetratricopeptide repeat protein [Bdellovibrionota bacterium]